MTTFLPKTTRDVLESVNKYGETFEDAVHHALIGILPLFMDQKKIDTYTLGEDLAKWLTLDLEDADLEDYHHGSPYLEKKEAEQ